VDQDTLAFLAGFLDEVKYFLSCDVRLVEQDLLLLVKPVEREVNDAHSFPLVLDLLARAVDDPRDLICDDKLHVLGSKLISNEQAILYLNRSDHVIRHHHHLLVVLSRRSLLLEMQLMSLSGSEHGICLSALLFPHCSGVANLLLRVH